MEGKDQLSEIETQRNSTVDQASESSGVTAVLNAEIPEETVNTSVLADANEKDLIQVLTEKAHDVKEVIAEKVHEVEALLVQSEPKESVSSIEPVIEPKAVAEEEPAVEIENKQELEPVIDSGSDLMKVLADKANEVKDEVQKTLECLSNPEPAKESVVDTNFSEDDFKKVEVELLTITDDIKSSESETKAAPKEETDAAEDTEKKTSSHLIDNFNEKINAIKDMNKDASEKLEELKSTLFQEEPASVELKGGEEPEALKEKVKTEVESAVESENKKDEESSKEPEQEKDLVKVLTEKALEVKETIQHKIEEFLPEPVAEPDTELVAESVAEPVPESISEPELEPVLEPIAEPVPEASSNDLIQVLTEKVQEVKEEVQHKIGDILAESVPEPVSEAVLEPKAESVPEPVSEEVVEPKTESKVELVLEPVSELVPKQVPESVSDAVSEPKAETVPERIPEPVSSFVEKSNEVKDAVQKAFEEFLAEPAPVESAPVPVVEAVQEPAAISETSPVIEEPVKTPEVVEQESKAVEVVLDVVSNIANQLDSIKSDIKENVQEIKQQVEQKLSEPTLKVSETNTVFVDVPDQSYHVEKEQETVQRFDNISETPKLTENQAVVDSEPVKMPETSFETETEAATEINQVSEFISDKIESFSDNLDQFQKDLEAEIEKEMKEQEAGKVTNSEVIELSASPNVETKEEKANDVVIEISPAVENQANTEEVKKEILPKKDKSPSPKRSLFARCSIL